MTITSDIRRWSTRTAAMLSVGMLGGLLMMATAASAHDGPEKLGTVTFPTSCSAAAQPSFVRGVALLHSVTPGAIQPAREMLAELLLELGQPAAALAEFEASGRVDPNRLHGLAGAGRAAEAAGDRAKARLYYERLIALTASADTERPEVKRARDFLGKS